MRGLDLKNNIRDRRIFTIIVALLIVAVGIGFYAYNKQKEYRTVMENQYNMAFFELVSYVQNVENYLAKSLISSTPEHGAETLTQIWREANLASAFLSQLPISNEQLSKTAKFLNQVSDYSYALSRKNIYNEKLTDEDLKNLDDLHNYSVELEGVLNQLASEMETGDISWGELAGKGSVAFAQEVSNVSQDSFSNLEGNFEQYAGLIYDGAYSEHLTSNERKGLTGEDIDEEAAKNKAKEFVADASKIKEIKSNGLVENGNIPAYDFYIEFNDGIPGANITISKKGGHLVLFNSNRDVSVENLTQEDANAKGKEYLDKHGFKSMKETYYLKENGIVTINYAYEQNGITVYSDLIKVKVALDNGEVLGVETSGYLNSHHERKIEKAKISMEKAKEDLNKNVEILSEGMAIIPTDWKSEIYCYEFKGKVKDNEFLVYINAENGREENILVIINTPNGTLTM